MLLFKIILVFNYEMYINYNNYYNYYINLVSVEFDELEFRIEKIIPNSYK